MSKLPRLSGTDAIKIFCNQFNFHIDNQDGSHVILQNNKVRPPIRFTVVKHGEIRTGTLRQMLRQSGVSRVEFLKAVNS